MSVLFRAIINITIKKTDAGMRGIFATRDMFPDYPIHILSGVYVKKPTRTSIQIGDKHLEDRIGQFLNHNCYPNSKISVLDDKPILVAVKHIKTGEEIRFDYNTTEERISNPFNCDCHNKLISGYAS